MADKKMTPTKPDAKATDEVEDQDKDKDTERKTAHPGYKRYRGTREFGG